MHFRVRGNNVQIVKTQTDAASGKAVSKPVGSASLASGAINEKAAAALTEAEKQTVQAWIARHQAIQQQKREVEFRTLADRLAEVASWVRGADAELVEEHAEDIQDGLRNLRRALGRKLGRSKPDQAAQLA